MNDDKDRKNKLALYLGEKHMWYINQVVHRPASQAEFALWLGVNPQTYTRLINEHSLPNLNNIIPMADKLGPELYDICGIPRLVPSDKDLQVVLDNWHTLSGKEKRALLDNLSRILEAKQEKLPNGILATE
jgi:DNA-binding XRE family transcriptional regulator